MTGTENTNPKVLTLNVQEIYGDRPAIEISNTRLKKIATFFGVSIESIGGGQHYKISQDPHYKENMTEQALAALKDLHQWVSSFTTYHPAKIRDGQILQEIMGKHQSNSRVQAETNSETNNIESRDNTMSSGNTATRATKRKPLTFNSEAAVTISRGPNEISLAGVHGYLSRQNRAGFLTEFEIKMDVRVEANNKGSFDIMMPVHHEGPVHKKLIDKITAVLGCLQTELDEKETFSRSFVQNKINMALRNELTSTFKKEAGTEPSTVRQETLDSASAEVRDGLSAEAAKLIRQIKLPSIEGKTENQRKYLTAIPNSDICFCIAPAGTGKTFLAIYSGLKMLIEGKVNSMAITRPAVNAEEELGFLPGTLKDKMDPYMRPVYKALMKLLAEGDTLKGKALLEKLLKSNVIEIAPLAYLRGDEFEKIVVIGDEFQNIKHNQMKMFLTRIAQGGRMIIVGDSEQTDLMPTSLSALSHVAGVFEKAKIPGINVVHMDESDAVRHKLIKPMLMTLRNNPVPADYDPFKSMMQDRNATALEESSEVIPYNQPPQPRRNGYAPA
jgi:phosphate starvation-inducible protein PhoH